MKRLILIPTLLAVMAVGALPLAFASHSTPLNGSVSGSFTVTSTTATITGTDHLEHLGKIAFAAFSTITGSASCEHGFTVTEKDTFTAANGDKLFASADEVACPTSTTAFTITGPLTITGGTGRFEHASGTGSVHISSVQASMTSGTFTATTTGTITY